MNIYKLRAEVIQDVYKFIVMDGVPMVGETVRVGQFIIDKPYVEIPDVDLTFTSEWSLEDLRRLIKFAIEDSHVMYESLNYEADYTGGRYYLDEV